MSSERPLQFGSIIHPRNSCHGMFKMGVSEVPRFRKRDGRLTLNEKYNIDPPSASCYRYNLLLLIPNGDAGGD
jgi:hypothetical protein